MARYLHRHTTVYTDGTSVEMDNAVFPLPAMVKSLCSGSISVAQGLAGTMMISGSSCQFQKVRL